MGGVGCTLERLSQHLRARVRCGVHAMGSEPQKNVGRTGQPCPQGKGPLGGDGGPRGVATGGDKGECEETPPNSQDYNPAWANSSTPQFPCTHHHHTHPTSQFVSGMCQGCRQRRPAEGQAGGFPGNGCVRLPVSAITLPGIARHGEVRLPRRAPAGDPCHG